MKIKFRVCSDPKHFAWATWTLLANNPVNKTAYLLFCLLDLLIIMFYSFILVQRVHFSNFDQSILQTLNNKQVEITNDSLTNFTTDSGGIQLSFLRNADLQLTSLSKDNRTFLLSIAASILALTIFILLVILLMAIFIKNHQGLEKSSFLKKCFCLILVMIQTFLHMPMFDLIFRTLFIAAFDDPLSILILRYLICSLSIIVFTILMLYLFRVFNVCVPTDLIPWCSPISKIVFLNLIIKGGLILCTAFDQQGNYVLIEVIILFVLQSFQASYRVLFAPNYLKEVDSFIKPYDLFVKTKDFTVCLIFFLAIICKALSDRSNFDLIYFIIFIPVVTIGWFLFEQYRIQDILLKVKKKQLKLEIEYEFALYVMMTLVRDSMSQNLSSQKIFGQLMDLMLTHIEECDDPLCICDEMENFYELLRLRQLSNQELFPLLREERKKYKKIIDDQGLIGTISNITDLTLKTHTTESTLVKTNNELDKLDKQAEVDDQQSKIKQRITGKQLEEDEECQQKRKKILLFQINIDETKHRFLSELLYLFYFEMIQKFPDSFKIQLLSNYFALHYKKKEMLCVFQMRSFNKLKLSKIDQCCHTINEQYLLSEIHRLNKISVFNSQNQQDGNFNGEYFIKMNQLYKDFNISIESLSSTVVNFWKSFERPQIDVEATYENGITLANNIKNLFKIFEDLDQMKLFKDYQMYFQFAIVQLHILNDPVAYELYIGKMKSILEINKVYQKNFSSDKNSDYSNFIIVDANGSKFGQIIQVNNSLRVLLGWDQQDVKRFRIEEFMPTLIKEKHPEFMARYNKTGQSFIINNKVAMFVRKSSGYVILVELYIKFHFSIDYNYTFLAILRPFSEMQPFQNGVRYNINQLIFLMTDNDEGRICEYSESCKSILKFDHKMEKDGITKKITDLILDFDFNKMKNTRVERYLINQIYENVHKLDLNCVSSNDSSAGMIRGQSYLSNQNISANNRQIVFARTRIFEERYSGGVLDLNIFCFLLVNENDGSLLNTSFSSKQQSWAVLNDQLRLQNENQTVNGKDIGQQNQEIDGIPEDSSSMTGSSSMKSSTTSMAEFRNFHSFNSQTTPRTLKVIIQLIIALYIVMMTVASVNLGLNLSRQLQSESDVHTVRQAYDRINWISMNQLLSRVLLNIANGYEPENSILVSDRFSSYIQLQHQRIQQLKNTQSELQQTSFQSSADFLSQQQEENLELYYLSDQNKPYIKYDNLNLGVNLYITKMTEMNGMSKTQRKGNLSIQTLTPVNSSKYSPSLSEQTIYFIVENGNRDLRQYAINSAFQYAQESQQHAEQNIISTKVTAIVSIFTIAVIGLIIAPILTTAEIRKYKALLYFLKIPLDKLPDLIKNCEYCLNMNDEDRYFQIQKDYENYLGIKLVNQQSEQLRQARDEKSNLDNQLSNDNGTQSNNKSNSYQLQYSSNEGSSSVQSRRNELRSERIYGEHVKKYIDQSMKAITAEQDNDIDHDNEDRNNDMLEQRKDDTANKNQFNQNNLNLKENGMKEQKTKKINKEENKGEEEEQITQQQQELSQKIKLINNRAYKRRSTLIFVSLSVILLLSTYFIIAYFMATNTFQTASDVIQYLEIIFYKGSCFDSAMNFLRENQIRNQSMMISGITHMSAADYYIDFCLKKEADYNQMRIHLPVYFDQATDYINNMESYRMCESIYTGEFEYLHQMCQTSLNGILNKGLTNAFYYMFTQILKSNLEFNSLGPTSARNYYQLKKAMMDPDIVQIIDMKAQVLDPALNQLKAKCMESVINYIQKLLHNFVTAFIVFSSLLSVALVILIFAGFKVLRKSMWDTNIILKIIPFETLPKKDRILIKDFFNS